MWFKIGTFNHILSGCKVALYQGRYRWRHDSVLKEIGKAVEERRKQINASPWKKKKWIKFIKTGESKKPAARPEEVDSSYLNTARDWTLKVDLHRRLVVPPHIMETTLRPDMLLISERSKQLGIVELTVPREDRVEVSAELKKMRYSPLEEAARRKGWKVRMWTIEVGCRGFPAASLATFMKDIGLTGTRKKTIIRSVGHEAERASQSIWRWSHWKQWGRY